MLTMDRSIRELVLKRASSDDMRAAAKSDGMATLQTTLWPRRRKDSRLWRK